MRELDKYDRLLMKAGNIYLDSDDTGFNEDIGALIEAVELLADHCRRLERQVKQLDSRLAELEAENG